MIKTSIYKDKNNNYTGYIISGHANYAENGKDIVCSAVSVISQAILLGLNKIADISHELIMDGMIDVKINNPDEKSNLLINILEETIKEISKQYPKYVSIIQNDSE